MNNAQNYLLTHPDTGSVFEVYCDEEDIVLTHNPNKTKANKAIRELFNRAESKRQAKQNDLDMLRSDKLKDLLDVHQEDQEANKTDLSKKATMPEQQTAALNNLLNREKRRLERERIILKALIHLMGNSH